MKTMTRNHVLAQILLFGCALFARASFAAGLESYLRYVPGSTPAISPQKDGSYYLPVSAATMLQLRGALNAQEMQADGTAPWKSKVWDNDVALPYWKIGGLKSNWYRAVLVRSGKANVPFRVRVSTSSNAVYEKTIIKAAGESETIDLGCMRLDSRNNGVLLIQLRPMPMEGETKSLSVAGTGFKELRLIPVAGIHELSYKAPNFWKKLGIDDDPAIKQRIDVLNEFQAKKSAAAKTAQTDPKTYTAYGEFLNRDECRKYLNDTWGLQQILETQRDELRRQKFDVLPPAKLQELCSGDENARKLVTEYQATRSAEIAAFTQTYPAPDMSPVAPPPLDFQPSRRSNKKNGVFKIDMPQPEDAAGRKQRFEQRNSPAELQKLCDAFNAVLKSDAKGLESFRALHSQKKYAEALDAYMAYFVDKMRNLPKYGIPNDLMYVSWPGDRWYGSAPWYICHTNPEILAMEEQFDVVVTWRDSWLVAKAVPGSINWAPSDLKDIEDAKIRDAMPGPEREELDRKISFYTQLNRPLGAHHMGGGCMYVELLNSYLIDGKVENLKKWCMVADDWCMNSRGDLDRCKANVLIAVPHEPDVFEVLRWLRLAAVTHPNFEREMNSATLARFLMKMLEMKPPYILRYRRTDIANMGSFGIAGLCNVAMMMPEFKACDYIGRESFRMWHENYIQHRTPDGENLSDGDTGHQHIDFAEMSKTVLNDQFRQPWIRPQDMEMLRCVGRNTFKYFLGELNQQGHKLFCRGDMFHEDVNNDKGVVNIGMYDGNLADYNDPVRDEPEVLRHLEYLGAFNRKIQPTVVSEFTPYGSKAFLRDSWAPDGEHCNFNNMPYFAVSTFYRTEYHLAKEDRWVSYGYPLLVDRRPPASMFGQTHEPEGKVTYLTQAGRNVIPTRFHTSERFDFTEGFNDAGYAHRPQATLMPEWDVYHKNFHFRHEAKRSNELVKDVKAFRQIYQVRGENLWIVHDRTEGDFGHEYTVPFQLPTRVPSEGFYERVRVLSEQNYPIIEENESEQRVRTAQLGFPNVSLYLFSNKHLTFANEFDDRGEPIRSPSFYQQADAFKAKGMNDKSAADKLSCRSVMAMWQGQGGQSLVSLYCLRPSAKSNDEVFATDLKKSERLIGPNGATGFHAVTQKGTEVWFQAGPWTANMLRAGPLAGKAEALLIIRRDGKLSGLAIGCRSLEINGQKIEVSQPDFEFEATAAGKLNVTQIRRPIDTIQIQPEQNVFIGSTQISFDIPTQDTSNLEFRYTLDGPDPTLESALYSAPITLDKTTLVKVRAFRKGLKETPYRCGVDSSVTIAAIFTREEPRPAVSVANAQLGLQYEYFEDNWPRLFTYAGCPGVLSAKDSGTLKGLLDPAEITKLRKTNGAYAIRSSGYIDVPEDGVYTVYAPPHLFDVTLDAGYDLRVFIDGEEWYPSPTIHAEHSWSIALKKGKHRLMVSYADFRTRPFKNELYFTEKESVVWSGTPKLEISGPDRGRRPIPLEWLFKD